ncbi:thiol-activated cytolysin family protein [Arcanobacterium canis]|uniref:Thiol-activated cytolysin family protein n=1 Tax=Arcanobacterium canis TaxID=999183 RepID=A0ABY8G0W7_9ACTO|nr:thiol-activated cytolysin family protein [Arcanobacterium canis]WFM83520.1 thiol-activated cytolysin family protein [Arcanobacterium canis]
MKKYLLARAMTIAFGGTLFFAPTAFAATPNALNNVDSSGNVAKAIPSTDNAKKIDNYIYGLSYDPLKLLAVNGEANDTLPSTTASANGDTFTVVNRTKKNLDAHTSDLSVIEANNAAIYPGALVRANQSLVNGNPSIVPVDRGSVRLSVDLPGLRDGKNAVDVPVATKSDVEGKVNGLLDGWLRDNKDYSKQAARVSYDETMVSSTKQFEAKFGTGAKKIADILGVNFNSIYKGETKTAVASFKQIFYTVSADAPTAPHKVFGSNVTLNDLKLRGIDKDNPAAYISSVSYGRQIYVKLETNSKSNEVAAAFDAVFKTKYGELPIDVATKYKDILDNTRISVYVLGGSPDGVKVATGKIADLKDIIQKESTFSTSVPAVPVSYTVNFLKDNSRAVVNSSGTYTETTATTYRSGYVTLKHEGGYMAKFHLSWDEVNYDAQGREVRTPKKWSGTWVPRTAGFTERIQLPANARNIHVIVGEATGLVWDPWRTIIDEANMPLVHDREITVRGASWAPYASNVVK